MFSGIKPAALYSPKSPRNSIDIMKNPLVYVRLPNEDVAKKIQERSVMIKEIVTVLSRAKSSYDDLIENVNKE